MCRMLAKSCKICCNKGVKTDKRLAVFAVGLRVERGLNIHIRLAIEVRLREGRAPRGARIEHSPRMEGIPVVAAVGLRVERGLNILGFGGHNAVKLRSGSAWSAD